MKPIEDQNLVLEMFESTFEYHHEFLGCNLDSIMMMLSEKVLVNLVLALADRKAGCISGDLLVGKSVLVNVSCCSSYSSSFHSQLSFLLVKTDKEFIFQLLS